MPDASIKILHIDDNEMTRYAVAKMLKNAGFTVVSVGTGKLGLEALELEHPELVLLDVNLPDMSGYEVCRRVKASPEYALVPVVHMSASFVRTEDQVRGLQGADGYIVEPVEPEVLIATIKAVLRVREAERERARAQRQAEEAQLRLKVLADVGHLLATSLAPDAVLEKIVSLLVPGLADAAVVLLFDEMGQARSFSSAHIDKDRAGLLQQMLKRYTPDLRHGYGRAQAGPARIVAPISDQFLMSLARDGEHFILMKGVGVGSVIWAEMRAHGHLLGAVVLATTTPERKFERADVEFADEFAHRMALMIDNTRLLLQAQQHNRMKDEFLATLAHELRNPLAPIRNATEIMATKLDDPVVMERLRLMIVKQVYHISRLIDDLTDVARIEHGKLVLRREVVDMASIVQNAIESCRDTLQRKQQSLHFEPPKQADYVNGDPTRLEQIISNLLHNASKYTPELGSIWISISRTPDFVAVKIKDNGIGIPSHLLPRIFELFTQAPQSLDRPQGGLGIGLTIVRHLVTLHSGSISARSDGEGKGSEFTLKLPATEAQPVAPAKTRTPTTTFSRKNVLVIDDNVDIRETLEVLIRSWGHDIRQVGDGEAGLQALRELKPQIVLLDIGLPGMDGYQVARKIRAVPEWKDLILVATTGYNSPADKQKAADAGFNLVLVKPVDLEKLEDVLNMNLAANQPQDPNKKSN